MITTDMTEETDTDRMLMCICKPRMKSACPKNGEIEIFDRLLSVPTQHNDSLLPSSRPFLKNQKAMSLKNLSRLAPTLANLRAGASLPHRMNVFRSLATEASASSSVGVELHLFSEPCLTFPS